jgi:hypothetical protein
MAAVRNEVEQHVREWRSPGRDKRVAIAIHYRLALDALSARKGLLCGRRSGLERGLGVTEAEVIERGRRSVDKGVVISNLIDERGLNGGLHRRRRYRCRCLQSVKGMRGSGSDYGHGAGAEVKEELHRWRTCA